MHVAARAWRTLVPLSWLAPALRLPGRCRPPRPTPCRSTRNRVIRAPTAPEAPRALRKIDFVTSTLSASGTPYLARRRPGHFFRSYGLDVTIQALSPAAATPAIQGGSAPLGATAGVTIAAVASGATELVFIGGVSNKILAQLFAQPELRSVADLRPGGGPPLAGRDSLADADRGAAALDSIPTRTYASSTCASSPVCWPA